MSVLVLNNVSLSYGKQQVVKDVSLNLLSGEIACLLGPSGCGKTTLLRAIAGFKSVQAGTIDSADQVLSSVSHTVATEKRSMGMVFQDFALFPHLTVAKNICFGIRNESKAYRFERLQDLLALIGLAGSGDKYPHELSGGQQQRVALARAIAPKPHLLLLDEPFSSMDVELRASLAKEIRSILKHEKITAVMVTHDQNEAFSMADQIGVLNQGSLLQWGDAKALYHFPKDAFVAQFVGQSNFLSGVIKDGFVETALGALSYKKQLNRALSAMPNGESVKVLVRPEYIQVNQDLENKAELISREFRGGHYLYFMRLQSGEMVQALLPSQANYELGESLRIALLTDQVSIFRND